MLWQQVYYDEIASLSSVAYLKAVMIASDDPATVFAAGKTPNGVAILLKTTGGAGQLAQGATGCRRCSRRAGAGAGAGQRAHRGAPLNCLQITPACLQMEA